MTDLKTLVDFVTVANPDLAVEDTMANSAKLNCYRKGLAAFCWLKPLLKVVRPDLAIKHTYEGKREIETSLNLFFKAVDFPPRSASA